MRPKINNDTSIQTNTDMTYLGQRSNVPTIISILVPFIIISSLWVLLHELLLKIVEVAFHRRPTGLMDDGLARSRAAGFRGGLQRVSAMS